MERTKLEANVEDAAHKAGSLLRSRYGAWTLGFVSFAESALVVPLVTDPFLSAYILADRKSALKGVIITVFTSVLGGVFAYAVAISFYEFIAATYLTGPAGEEFTALADEFQKGTFVITVLGAVTPVPYTLVALAAGFVKSNFLVFVFASAVGRAFRYGLVAWLTYHFGEHAIQIARQHLIKVTILLFVLAAIYFFVIH